MKSGLIWESKLPQGLRNFWMFFVWSREYLYRGPIGPALWFLILFRCVYIVKLKLIIQCFPVNIEKLCGSAFIIFRSFKRFNNPLRFIHMAVRMTLMDIW